MAKRSNPYANMGGNMGNLMKQAQKMQRQMEEGQKALEAKEFKSSVGGGVVTLAMNGKREILSLKIDPEALDPEDVEELEDMIKAAFRDALGQIDAEQTQQISSLTGGMGGLGGGMF